MTCAEFEDRLFDEDCRAGLLGRSALPADVAEHAAQCPACARQWAEALADAQRLSRRLVVAPPPALRRDLYLAFRPKESAWGACLPTRRRCLGPSPAVPWARV
jgi:predicted anti-sigma-YlaC factor YlaD